MARSILSLVWFTGTALFAGLIIAAGAVITVEKLADAVAAAPVNSSGRPSYIASFPRVAATDLDIAKSVPVAPVIQAVAVRPPAFTHEVAVNSLWMRAKPTKYSSKVALLERGAQLSVSRTDGRWALVTGPDGQGWVYEPYLRPTATPRPDTEIETRALAE